MRRVFAAFLFFAFVLVVAMPCWAVDLEGTWKGGWYSCTSGHKGPLRATFCRLDNGDYEVAFRGRFLGIIPFRYSVQLAVIEETDSHVVLEGSSYLGRRFGTFYYAAQASDCEFHADYSSCRDDGYFWLERCCSRCN